MRDIGAHSKPMMESNAPLPEFWSLLRGLKPCLKEEHQEGQQPSQEVDEESSPVELLGAYVNSLPAFQELEDFLRLRSQSLLAGRWSGVVYRRPAAQAVPTAYPMTLHLDIIQNYARGELILSGRVLDGSQNPTSPEEEGASLLRFSLHGQCRGSHTVEVSWQGLTSEEKPQDVGAQISGCLWLRLQEDETTLNGEYQLLNYGASRNEIHFGTVHLSRSIESPRRPGSNLAQDTSRTPLYDSAPPSVIRRGSKDPKYEECYRGLWEAP